MKKRGITIRLGPLGLSLLAAGITAVGVAAVSLADSGNGSGSGNGNSGGSAQTLPPPPGGGPRMLFRDNLSAADRQKLEDFRTCMEDNGAPAPPDPSKIDPSQGPPTPPSAADREKAEKAYEACKSKLPEKLQNAGPPGVGTFQCGPPPGAPPQQGQSQKQGSNQNQSSQSNTQSSGSAA
jgi:hypothetical protein